jgi:two-component system chemotaxis response regulator CheV
MSDRDGILLESGTNEVEILEFELDGQGFGVNVLKVQAIEQFDASKVTEIQLSHPAVIGTYSYREGVISLVDLGKELEIHDGAGDALTPREREAVAAVLDELPVPAGAGPEPEAQPENTAGRTDLTTAVDAASDLIETRIVLVLEFNEVTTGFLVDGVNRIHRVSWDAISALSPFLAAVHSKFTGSLNIERREILVVDMERVLADILPSASGAYHFREDHDTTEDARRAQIPVYLAEDSVTIRAVMVNELERGGYTELHSFDNGLACYEALQVAVNRARAEDRPVREAVGIVVSDIEMPQLDGMTLCKRFKQELGQQEIPVVLFSSLINEQIAHKCEAVGADRYISKPRFNELLETVDSFVL